MRVKDSFEKILVFKVLLCRKGNKFGKMLINKGVFFVLFEEER